MRSMKTEIHEETCSVRSHIHIVALKAAHASFQPSHVTTFWHQHLELLLISVKDKRVRTVRTIFQALIELQKISTSIFALFLHFSQLVLSEQVDHACSSLQELLPERDHKEAWSNLYKLKKFITSHHQNEEAYRALCYPLMTLQPSFMSLNWFTINSIKFLCGMRNYMNTNKIVPVKQ